MDVAASSDDDQETFVTIGTAFEVAEETEPRKKLHKVEDQVVTDSQGRRRFHGAFTGGFSAGYFNTVGSKEGWAPASFRSTRAKRSGEQREFKPEDFMDEEDFSEHGIAPRKFALAETFESDEKEVANRKRQIHQALKDKDVTSAVPGGLPLEDLIIPSKLSVGVRLLKKMGWKPGQGIGDKLEYSITVDSSKDGPRKTYGCSLPSRSEDQMDLATFKYCLAPKDLQPMVFTKKDNTHGLGYSGLDPVSAMFAGSQKDSVSFRPTGKERRGIRGQAFGVGALEDEDEDVYMADKISDYDVTMEIEEDAHKKFGWSGPQKKKAIKGCLEGFQRFSLQRPPNKVYPPPSLPRDYVPKHTLPKQLTCEQAPAARHKLSSKDRGLMLGEIEKGLEAIRKWTLKWDRLPEKSDSLPEKLDGLAESLDRAIAPSSDVVPPKPKVGSRSRWDSEITRERPKVPVDASKPPEEPPVVGPTATDFKPFSRIPSKQARYEHFLACRREGKELRFSYDREMTEWEQARELEEFARASLLYRPLAKSMASRFTPATEDSGKTASGEDAGSKSDERKAAEMGLYGPLTRKTHEWHPERILCKRFNIPDPYPGSKVKGVPGRAKEKSGSMFDGSFAATLKPVEAKRTESEDEEEDAIGLISKRRAIGKAKIVIGPLSHLNRLLTPSDASGNSVELATDKAILEAKEIDRLADEAASERPPIDLFKAIFSDSDSSSDDSEDERVVENKEAKASHVAGVIDGSEKAGRGEAAEILLLPVSESTDSSRGKLASIVELPASAIPVEPVVSGPPSQLPLAFLNRLPSEASLSDRLDKRVSDRNSVLYRNTPVSGASVHPTSARKESPRVDAAIAGPALPPVRPLTSGLNMADSKDRNGARDRDPYEKRAETENSRESENSRHRGKKKKEKKKKTKKKKHSKKSKHARHSSQSESDSESSEMPEGRTKTGAHAPSDKELVDKLKKYGKLLQRPSAADFM